MSNPQGAPPQKPINLMRMRSDSPDEMTSLAKRLLDPNYIRKVLRNSIEKNQFNLRMQQAIRARQQKRALVPRQQLHPRHPVPPVRSGEASDVLDALMGVPAFAKAFETMKSNITNKLKRDWKQLSAGEKATVITQAVSIGGGSLAGVLASKPGCKELYELLRDRDIPISIPGVTGLKIQLKTGKEHKAMLMFDIAEFLSSDK